jgi:hypothetical protein
MYKTYTHVEELVTIKINIQFDKTIENKFFILSAKLPDMFLMNPKLFNHLRFQIVVFYIINFDQVNIIAFSTL